MDFREYEVTREGNDVIVTGTIREPVNWDFTIRMTGDDIPGMLRLGLHRHTLAMAAHWLFRRRSRSLATAEPAPAAKPEPMVSPRAVRKAPVAAVSPRPAQPGADNGEPEVEEPKVAEPDKIVPAAPAAPAAVDARPQRPARPAQVGKATADFGTPRRRGEPVGGPKVATDAVARGAGT
ncbi:MAG TPA: hypothetical protein VNF71_04735 [Acidimicrobiales bacterium]|nr:hypothetical protein [Acidimicrobiales bacterium]